MRFMIDIRGRKRRIDARIRVLMCAWAWLMVAAVGAQTAGVSRGGVGQSAIQWRLDSLLDAPFLATGDAGIAVFDLTADTLIYGYQADRLFRPASVMKLLTGITAVDRLTADYMIRTTVVTDGVIADSVLDGNIYLKGDFDSEFTEADMDSLISQIQSFGIKTITGNIYANVSMKDSLPYNPGWSWDDGYYYYQPELTPLIYHKGYVTLTMTPSSAKRRSTITIDPPTTLYTIDNKTSGRGKLKLYRNLTEGDHTLYVSGRVRKTTTDHVTVPRPYELFADVFANKLAAVGITAGSYAGICTPLYENTMLAEVPRPMTEILTRALKNSDNISAEALFYHLAVQQYIMSDTLAFADTDTAAVRPDAPSWENGAEAVRGMLCEIGLPADSYGIADGCGLSSHDDIPADAVISMLRYAYSNKQIFNTIYNSLAIAGVDGSLRNRMKNTPAYNNVHAKTGFLTGVNALAGYLTTADGRTLAFAILLQTRNNAAARAFQETICNMLCQLNTCR